MNKNSHAWCPRFASVFWTLTWAEEGSGRPTEHFQLTISGRPIRFDPTTPLTQVSPTEGRTWGTGLLTTTNLSTHRIVSLNLFSSSLALRFCNWRASELSCEYIH